MNLQVADRERRRDSLARAIGSMSSPEGLGFVSTLEDRFLLADAIRCFQAGIDAGAIFCAHACCERDLASLVKAAGTGSGKWDRWGLGPLVAHCESRHDVPENLAKQLRNLNEDRKALYHFGHSDTDASVGTATSALIADLGDTQLRADFRALSGRDGDNKEVWGYATERALEAKALSAIEATLQLRSWFAEVGL